MFTIVALTTSQQVTKYRQHRGQVTEGCQTFLTKHHSACVSKCFRGSHCEAVAFDNQQCRLCVPRSLDFKKEGTFFTPVRLTVNTTDFTVPRQYHVHTPIEMTLGQFVVFKGNLQGRLHLGFLDRPYTLDVHLIPLAVELKSGNGISTAELKYQTKTDRYWNPRESFTFPDASGKDFRLTFLAKSNTEIDIFVNDKHVTTFNLKVHGIFVDAIKYAYIQTNLGFTDFSLHA